MKTILKKVFFLTLFALIFTAFLSLSVSANPTQTRSLPTIYKVTGDINLSNQADYYFLLAYVSTSSADYPVGLSASSCSNFDTFKTLLGNGIFIGPISSDVVGYTNKTFELKLSIQAFATENSCNTAYDLLEGSTNSGGNYQG